MFNFGEEPPLNVPTKKSGFLYVARNAQGNYFTGAKTGNYPQINLLQTDKNGFAKLKEDVDYTSNLTYWTDGKKLIPKGVLRGKYFLVTPSDYSFYNGVHYFVVKTNTVTGGNDTVSIQVYKADKTLLQSYTVPNLAGVRVVQANKSLTEIVLIGNLEEYATASKALPFSINDGEYSKDFIKTLRLKWEGIVRVGITASGNEVAPYSFSVADYQEQWAAFAYITTDNSPEPVINTGLITHKDGEFRYTETTSIGSNSTVLIYATNTVIHAYFDYNSDVLKTVSCGSVNVSGAEISSTYDYRVNFASDPPGMGLKSRIKANYNRSGSSLISFQIAGKNYIYQFDRTESYSVEYPMDNLPFYPSYPEPIVNTQSVTSSQQFITHEFNKFWVYSKLNPPATITELSSVNSTSAIVTPPYYFPDNLKERLTPNNPIIVDYAISEPNNVINFPTKNSAIFPANHTSAFLEKTSSSSSDGKKTITVIDVRQFIRNGSASANYYQHALILTDKFNNHCAVWPNSPDYIPQSGAPALGKIVNSSLQNPVDLTAVILYPFLMDDFIGSI